MSSPSKVFRFPVYQIDFSAVAAGKHVAASKRRIRWRYGFPNRQALEAGRTGTDCRGEEHEIVIIWSVTSGKRQILMDGKEIHYASSRTSILDHSWSTRGNHVMKVIAHAAPPLSATPGFRQYDLLIDGQSFFTMPKVFELGIRGVQDRVPVRTAGYIADTPAYGGGGSSYEPERSLRAPRTHEEEEEDLKRAINESLEESKRHLDRKNVRSDDSVSFTSPPPPTTADLLDFGGGGDNYAPAPALPAPPASDPYGASVVPYQNGYAAQQSPYGGSSYGAPPQQQPYPGAPPPPAGIPTYGEPPAQQNYLALPAIPGQGAPPPPQYGAPPTPQSAYGSPPPQPPQYGSPPLQPPPPYGAPPPPPPAYGAPPSYGAPVDAFGAPAASPYDATLLSPEDPFAPKPPSHNEIASDILKGYGSPMPNQAYHQQQQQGYQTPGSNYQPGQPLSLENGDEQNGMHQNGTGGPKFTMNSLAEEEDEEPQNEFEAAFKKLVNIDHIDEAPEEKIKLTMKKQDDKAKKLKGKSQPKPPAAVTLVGTAATLEQIKQVKPETKVKEGIMNAPPQPWDPRAAQAGMLVIHGQAPPQLGPPQGFGAGYNPGYYGGGGGGYGGSPQGGYGGPQPGYGGPPAPAYGGGYPPQQPGMMQQGPPPPQGAYGGYGQYR